MTWMKGNPPKVGTYTVKCDGPNPNKGFRYWNGEIWGNLCGRYQYAQEIKCSGRRSQLKREVLWFKPDYAFHVCAGKFEQGDFGATEINIKYSSNARTIEEALDLWENVKNYPYSVIEVFTKKNVKYSFTPTIEII